MKKTRLRTLLIAVIINILLSSEFTIPLLALSNSVAYQKASGTLTIDDGKSRRNVDLKHVYISDAPYTTPDGVMLTFTDKPLPDDPVKRWNYARILASEGKLNTLVVVLDSERKANFSVLYLDTSGTPVSDRDCWMNYEGDDEVSYDDPDDEQIFESKSSEEGRVSGTLRSSLLRDSDYRNKAAKYQYKITFDATVETPPSEVKTLSSGGGEPGKVCLTFLKSPGAESARKLLVADRQKIFEGGDGQKRFARFKAVMPDVNSIIPSSYISSDGKCALLGLSDVDQKSADQSAPPGELSGSDFHSNFSNPLSERPEYPPEYATRAVRIPPPPPAPPPPPPHASMPKLVKVAAPMTMVGQVRMIMEGGQWKVDWITFWYEEPNILSRLDSCKTSEEKRKERESQQTAEDALFKIVGGTRLPAGGGEAGKAYLEFCKAESAGDKATYLKFVTGAQSEYFNRPDKSIGIGGYKWASNSSLDYSNIQVTGGVSQGNRAVLNAKGIIDFSSEVGRKYIRDVTGKAVVMLEGGSWKVISQRWAIDRPASPAVRRRR